MYVIPTYLNIRIQHKVPFQFLQVFCPQFLFCVNNFCSVSTIFVNNSCHSLRRSHFYSVQFKSPQFLYQRLNSRYPYNSFRPSQIHGFECIFDSLFDPFLAVKLDHVRKIRIYVRKVHLTARAQKVRNDSVIGLVLSA